jgi:hypothetical protein
MSVSEGVEPSRERSSEARTLGRSNLARVDQPRFELGRRRRMLPPPPRVVWESLTEPKQPNARPWLNLLDDEVEPRIIESARPTLVVWSSIWPQTPDQVIRFELTPDGSGGTALTWILTSPTPLDDPGAVGHRRYRLNHLLWADLRYSYGQ